MTTIIPEPAPRDGAPAMAAEGVAQIDVVAVNSEQARTLYKAREPIYPKLAHGPYRAIKWALLFVTLGIYYGLPWVRWPRSAGEPDQAVLVDFEGRRFYFFFIEIWPQEVYYITGLLILAALALFLTTALFGRLWCGYACPQTVWTDLYIAVERFVEGDRNKRMRLAAQPWTPSKIAKKALKHAIWLLIAFATGGAWVLYFHDAPTLARDFFVGEAAGSAYLFAGILTFTTYSLAGMMREQVCTYMCPWPRIQGAMTDRETLEVTYRHDRGEPRGPHKRGESWEGRGDCIDCNLCVAVCPMGIDIRDGDQLECINCGLCIDACNDVMAKVGRPKGLIAYDSGANLDRRVAGGENSFRPIRARTVYYGAAFVLVAVLMLVGLSTRSVLDLNVLRDRNPNFVRLSDGAVRNGYEIKILNKRNTDQEYRFAVTGPEGVSLRVIGQDADAAAAVLRGAADSVTPYRIFVTVPEAAIDASSLPVTMTITNVDSGESARKDTVLQTGYAS